MHLLDSDQTLILLPKQVYSFASSTEIIVRMEVGRVWITAKGIPDDYMLEGGDNLILPPSPHIVVEAEQAFARFEVQCRTKNEVKRTWLQNLRCMLSPSFGARR